jgi:hypothetical protein
MALVHIIIDRDPKYFNALATFTDCGVHLRKSVMCFDFKEIFYSRAMQDSLLSQAPMKAICPHVHSHAY